MKKISKLITLFFLVTFIMSCQKDIVPLKSNETIASELIAAKRSMPGVMATVNGVEFISTNTNPLSNTKVSAFSVDEEFPIDSNLVNPLDSNEVFPLDTNLVNPIDSNVYVITDPIYVDPTPVDPFPEDTMPVDPIPVDAIKVEVLNSSPYYATFGSNDSSLIILADGQMPSQDSVQYAKILLWITRFKGEDVYSINDFSSLAVFSIVDSANNLKQYASSDLPNNGNVTITYFDKEANTISGTFEFTGISNDSSLIVVKNGVFNFVKIN